MNDNQEKGMLMNEKLKYLWEFELKDGSFIRAKFTDDEIKEMQIKYPQIRWS
jgi:hypothetical protein